MEWSVNVGEQILDIFVGRFSRSLSVGQFDVIALGEHSIFCIKENGTIRLQKRLDFHPSSVTSYTVEEGRG